MKVFISWSGDLSRNVATLFSNWLPDVIQECSDPFISFDIAKGDPWFETITSNLKDNELGVVLVTTENMQSSWLNFEAGALLNKFDKSGVRPLFVDLKKEDYKGPMSNLQLTDIDDKADVLRLMKSINERCNHPLQEKVLEKAFNSSWDEFSEGVRGALAHSQATKGKPATRPQGDKIDEILNLVRGIASDNKGERKVAGPQAVGQRGRRTKMLDAFEKKYGTLTAIHKSNGNSGEVVDFKESDGKLAFVVVAETDSGQMQIWKGNEVDIIPF